MKLASSPIDPKLALTLNHGMMQVERNWLNPDGIPGRPWFKHTLYGARFTYAHLELPGLTEAVEKQDWPTAQAAGRNPAAGSSEKHSTPQSTRRHPAIAFSCFPS